MNKLQGKLVAGLAAVAVFGVLGSAQAQPAGAPPVVDTPPPPSMPMMASPPPAPMASDSMAGQLGFGAGVTAGATSLIAPGAVINMKYWLSDVLAIQPQLKLRLLTAQAGDAQWQFAPAALLLYCPWKTTSTRLSFGGGLGLGFSKLGTPTPTDATISITLPIYGGVEHFFTKWFSMGIAVQNNLVEYTKTGPLHNFNLVIDNTINTTTAIGFLFFYTD
jgi:hypothetical protein